MALITAANGASCIWGIDAQTLEIRAMEVTDNRTSDTTMLPERRPQIPKAEQLVTVTTDGAYDTRLCHAAIAARGAASHHSLIRGTAN
ncbi:hypothetical protein GKE73_18175 [Paludibacterium sp. dN 18-1]|uniref:Transposase IS4-like domain-containing protein n=1 Tax=Paludibacterium denitrificans TaxID=2675226 RepID=A0A844GCI9_9NEIS|nr:hypothetical protein [Paludibacterium denitrificans]